MDYPGLQEPKKPFSPAKTGVKGGKELAAGSVAGLIAMWIAGLIWGTDMDPEKLALYTGILVGPVSGALMMLRNIAREIARRYGFDFLNILPLGLVFVAVMSGGCAFSGFKEITNDTFDEEGVLVPGEKMVQRTFVFTPPFARHAGQQRFSYEAKPGPDGGWILTNGQEGEADGGDPTALINAIGGIYAAALSARPAPQAGVQGAFTPSQVSQLDRVFRELGGRLDALGAELKAVKAQE